MVSIKVKDDTNNSQAEVAIELQGKFTDLVPEIVIGAVAATKRATGNRVTYHEAIDILHIALDEFEGFEEVYNV